jgi:hypothetical protein
LDAEVQNLKSDNSKLHSLLSKYDKDAAANVASDMRWNWCSSCQMHTDE